MQIPFPRAGYAMIVMASVVVVLAGIKAASVIVVPFLLALFIAIILSPLFLWLKAKGVPQIAALLLVIVLLFGAIATLMLLIGTSVQDFSKNVPLYEAKLRDDLQHFLEVLHAKGFNVPKEDIMELFAADKVMAYIAKTLKSLGSLLTNSFMIIVTVAFLLLEISSFGKKLASTNIKSLENIIDVSASIKRFIMLKSLTSAATGIVIAVALQMLEIHYAVLWGVVAFLLNFIPNIGSVIAAVPAVLMALIQYDLSTAAVTAGIYLAVNITIGSILEPRIMGRGLGISPLIVFLSLIFWGWLLGPVGMLLSVPLTIMVKIVLDNNEETKWMATLLGS
jgi:predicted PurR-regulated permease PerM